MSHYISNFTFGPYQLDLTKRILMCEDKNISLTPKATDLLVILVSNVGQLVETDELLREVWPNTDVEEANLAQFPAKRHLAAEPSVIAVFPFHNTTANLEFGSFADTVTDTVIKSLSRQSNVRVMSHSAVDHYRTGNIDPKKPVRSCLPARFW
jgi:hypothetical protein